MTAETTPRVMASWIGCTEPSRERMSPTWRFSKKSAGRRSRWRTRLPTIWKVSSAPNTRSAQVLQRLDAGLHHDQRAKGEREHEQEVAIGVKQRLVDDQLQLERRCKHGDLQRRRQQQHLGQAPR